MSGSISYSDMFKVLKEGLKASFDKLPNGPEFSKDVNIQLETNLKKILHDRKVTAEVKEETQVPQTDSKTVRKTASKDMLNSGSKSEEPYEVYENNQPYINNNMEFENKNLNINKFTLDFDAENVKRGFIYSEILGKPKCKRRRGRG